MSVLTPRPQLAEALTSLPDKAGVYLFKDGKGRLLYVGKAESLRDRVRSLEAVAGFCGESLALTGAGEPVQLTGWEHYSREARARS
jgi:hypothetical protein